MPAYNPNDGLVLEHLVKNKVSWEVRVKRDQKILWQRTINGRPSELRIGFEPSGREYNDGTMGSPSGLVVIHTTTEITADNRYRIPGDTYKFSFYFEGATGKLRKVDIDRVGRGYKKVLTQEFDRNRGNIVIDDRYHFQESPSGQFTLTRDFREYDPVFLDLIERRLFTYGEREGQTKGWVEVE
jgi:hypothetical protein